MAKHRRRRHRRYGDYVKVPGLSGLMSAFKSSVKVSDLALGVAAGFGGVVLTTYAVSKYSEKQGSVSEGLYKAIPYLGALVAGGGLYMWKRKRNRSQANALLVGSLVGGLVPVGWSLVKKQFASLSFLNGLAAMDGVDGYVVQPALSGVIVNNALPQGALQGVIVDNPDRGLGAYADVEDSEDLAQAMAP